MAAMETHDHGMVHLGDDGVLRSFDPNGTVLEYVRLSTNQIQQMLDSHGRTDHYTEVFDGVDGREVTDLEQLTNPGKHLLPRVPFTDSTMSAGATNCKYLQHFIHVKRQNRSLTSRTDCSILDSKPDYPRYIPHQRSYLG